ncbi:MAG: DNA-directed RNA polymerase subunit omega [Deltaproteobacteria bacterium]|nr:DNA-directed RNA polymerase subunit omega [Deltaproteobacteria bacterium]
MARVTVEDCLTKVENRFALVHAAAKRAKMLYKGATATLECKNKEVVTALREIADGTVKVTATEEEETTKKKKRK